jgi:hypothetical protein
MAKTQILLFVACILCVVAGPANAAPILLVEFSDSVTTAELGNPSPATVPFDFDAYDPILSLTYADWRQEYGPSDVGMTFSAPAEIVTGVNQAISSPTSKYLLETGPANFSSERPFYLPAHTVTTVERIIDRLEILPPAGDFYVLNAAQRVRIWGSPIPEANTISLLLIGVGQFMMIAFRRRYCPT